MGLLSSFIANSDADDEMYSMSDAATQSIFKGVFPQTSYVMGEETFMKFSSRRPLNIATNIARNFIRRRYDAEAKLEQHDDYEFRGVFWMSYIDRR